jgi:hypothetical protein
VHLEIALCRLNIHAGLLPPAGSITLHILKARWWYKTGQIDPENHPHPKQIIFSREEELTRRIKEGKS